MAENYPLDFSSSQEILAVQGQKLQAHLAYLQANSPFYKKLFLANNIQIEAIKSLADLKIIPTTTKRDLAENNRDFFAVPTNKIVEYVTTSGTTGAPIIIALTADDIKRLAENEARALHMAGISEDDLVQITTTIDQRFMAGMAYYLGLQKIGAASIRMGHGHPQIHADNMSLFNPTAIIAVPSFLHKLGKFLKENSVKNNIKTAICIGEPLHTADFTDTVLTENVKKYWSANLRSTYASTEMATAFTECQAQKGGHLLPELVILELLDAHGKDVQPGELGEIVVTPLGVSGTPLLRYRTGDLARLHTEVCSCGRTTPRLGPIEGRKEHQLKIKGTTIFPQQIERVLQEVQIDLFVIELGVDENKMEQVTLLLDDAISEEDFASVENKMRAKLRVRILFRKVPKSILKSLLFPPGSRKPMKIHDLRNV